MMDRQEIEVVAAAARQLRVMCTTCHNLRPLFAWAYKEGTLTCPYCATESSIEKNAAAEVLIRIVRLPVPTSKLFTADHSSLVTRRISERLGWW